jgi:outer membrane protein TolC
MRPIAAFLLCLVAGTLSAQELLTAEQAVNSALEKNHGVRLAKISLRGAELMNSAGEAGMLPTIDMVGEYDWDNSATRQVFFSGEVRDVDNANTQVLSSAIQLNWTVFDGLTMFATRDRLGVLETIERTALRQQLESTIYNVLASYYRSAQLRKAIEVQQEGLRTSRERLTIVKTGEQIGSYSGLQVVQARLDLSADSSALLELLEQEALAQSQLNVLLGRDPGIRFTTEQLIPATEALDLAALQQDARNANSTLQAARQQQVAADLSVKELKGVLFPRIDIFGNYAYRRSESDVGFLQTNRAVGPDYGVRFSVPLYRAGQAGRAVEVAKLSSEQAVISSEQTQLIVEQQLLDAWTSFTTSLKRIALEEDNLQGAQTQLNVALESFRLGVITAVELRDVQQSLIDAENRLLLAQYEAKLAELQLKWLAGRLV